MNIAVGITCLVTVVVLAGVTGLSEDKFSDDSEATDNVDGILTSDTPWDRRVGKSMCRQKLGGRCVKRRKPCPSHRPHEEAPGKPYCSKYRRCCHSEVLSVEGFIFKFHKVYANPEEESKRIGIFKENVKSMEEHNKLYESGKSTFLMGVNEFSDMNYDEIMSQMTGIDTSAEAKKLKQSIDEYVPIDLGKEPASLDYREKGAVNPVRNQGQCGSCWAFSTIASLEGNIFLKTGALPKLSEQDLVECKRNDNGECSGWWPEWAIESIAIDGIANRKEYPYTAPNTDTCKINLTRTYPVKAHKRVRRGQEEELLNALVHIGPLSIVIKVPPTFGSYSRGVFFDEACETRPDDFGLHAMALVGYGTENGEDYWLIKNSWGASWGDNGYMKLARNQGNHCQIADEGEFPVLKDDEPLPDHIKYKDVVGYEEIWNDKVSGGKQHLSIWRARNMPSGFCSLGDVAVTKYAEPTARSILVASNTSAVVHPVSFTKIWTDAGSGATWDCALYTMNAPYGYTCLGGVAMRHHRTKPNRGSYCCIHNSYIVPGNVVETYKETGTDANEKLSLWTIVKGSDQSGLPGGNFLPVKGYDKPLNGHLLNGEKASKEAGVCLTTDDVPCVFPFRYQGVLYDGCTTVDHDQYWCSTQVDENGDHVGGEWGNCKGDCNTDNN